MIVKQVVGIDVSKDELVYRMGSKLDDDSLKFSTDFSVENKEKGFNLLLSHVQKFMRNDLNISFVMEATGVYHEELAFYLDSKKQKIHVVLPSLSKSFGKSLNIKSKTDKIDAKILVQLGLERNLTIWEAPSLLMKELKSLSRIRASLVQDKYRFSNKLHAQLHSYSTNKYVIRSIKSIIKSIEKEVKKLEEKMQRLVQKDAELLSNINRVCKIKGLSTITVITIVAETYGFKLFYNRKQLASFAGFDVRHHESGAHKGKSRITKKGNKYIRSALYMPALSASQHNKQMKDLKRRINERNSIKNVATIAIARKLLLLMFSVWKNGTEYQDDFEEKRQHKTNKGNVDNAVKSLKEKMTIIY